MTNEENIKAILESNFAGFKGEIIERATKSILELEPKKSDDAIHSGDVLTAINDFCQCVEEYGAYSKLYDFVENLPPVSTEKTGRWIKIKPYPLQMHDYECSECGHETDDNTEKHCSECGAKMEVVECEDAISRQGEKNISKGFEDFMIKSLRKQAEREDAE